MCRKLIASLFLGFLASFGDADVVPPFNPLADKRKPKPPPKPQTTSKDPPESPSSKTESGPVANAAPSKNSTRLPSIKVLRSTTNNDTNVEDSSIKQVTSSQGSAPPCTQEAATLCHAVLAAAGTYADLQACLQQNWESLGAECQLYTHVATVCDFMAIREVCTSSSSSRRRRISSSVALGSEKSTQESSANSIDDGDSSSSSSSNRGSTTTTTDGSRGGSSIADANHFGDASTPQHAADCVERVAAAHAVGRARVPQSFLNFSHADCAVALRALPIQGSGTKSAPREDLAPEKGTTVDGNVENGALANAASTEREAEGLGEDGRGARQGLDGDEAGQEQMPLPLSPPSMAAFAATWAQDQAEALASGASSSARETALTLTTNNLNQYPRGKGSSGAMTPTAAVAVEADTALEDYANPFDSQELSIDVFKSVGGKDRPHLSSTPFDVKRRDPTAAMPHKPRKSASRVEPEPDELYRGGGR
jgi:hypothetical protein